MKEHTDNIDIAVLMPVYNPGPEIQWTINSLREQTIPFKLFLVDDGSTLKPDYSMLLEGIPYKLIELEKNQGIVGALNTGISAILAEGIKFIARMDNGDWCYPQRLELQRKYLLDHPAVYLVGSSTDVLEEDHSLSYTLDVPEDQSSLIKLLFYNMPLLHPTLMMRTDLFQAVGPYSLSADVAEEYELCRRALQKFEVGAIAAPLVKVVFYPDGISTQKRTRQLISRLKIQWNYRNLSNIHFYLGIAKTLTLMITPTRLVKWIKSRRYFRQSTTQGRFS